jgi:hypothetical protein
MICMYRLLHTYIQVILIGVGFMAYEKQIW